MGVFDKFMDIMKLNDDDDYDDDFYEDDYEEDTSDSKSRRTSLFGRKKQDDSFSSSDADAGNAYQSASKVTPIRQPGRSVASMAVCVVKPNTVDDSRGIAETLLAGRTVILNLEGLDLEVAQRIIDFTSGTAFAINGNLQKISNYIFLVTPTNVDISGDLQDLLGNSMETPSMRRF